jgi:OOP family OmpA-OmpF porin
MKKSLVCCTILSSLAFLGTLSSASAENRAGAFTVTPGVGYYFFSDQRNLNNTAVLPTLALAYDFNERWALEGAYGSMHTNYSPSNMQGGVNGNLYSVDGIYRFSPFHMIEPYVSAGLGVLYLSQNGTDANSQANLNAGLGAQIFFDRSVALRAEVRDLYTMAHGQNDVMLNLGVSFLFGGNQEAAAAPVAYKPAATGYKK